MHCGLEKSRVRTTACWFALAACLCGASGAGEPAGEPTPAPVERTAAERPNIVWLTSEDHGPHWGCYGDSYASTPHADRMARRSLRYTRVWSNAPVCAPARTTLITGMYPPSIGAEAMRSMTSPPAGVRLLPQLLRDAGYYCSNQVKEDYNVRATGAVWDDSSARAHWKHREPGRPFFAVFNSTKSHESQIRKRPHQATHDPRGVRLPAYHPDEPEVRQDWAQYYDQVTAADADAGRRLDELAEAGLADDTIVFYFSDHGSGMPGNKRVPQNSGLHVPLLVHVPAKFRGLAPSDYREGGTTDRLVSFVDFAPTVLSLAGVRPPDWMQGEAFLGPFGEAPRRFAFGFRSRMDERIDLVRSVTDGRHVYVRQFMPHRSYGQFLDYMFQTPTTRVWHRLHEAGRLNAAQDAFWREKPAEQLFDLECDPDEVRNLVEAPEQAELLARFRSALDDWERSIRDLSFLPEGELHRRAGGAPPRDALSDDARYPFEAVYAAAQRAARRDPRDTPRLEADLADRRADSAVRYWAAVGLLIRGDAGAGRSVESLRGALDDPSPDVRIAAAEGLARYGTPTDVERALDQLERLARWGEQDLFTALAALNSLDLLGPIAASRRATIAGLPAKGPAPHGRYGEYVPRLIERFQAQRPPERP